MTAPAGAPIRAVRTGRATAHPRTAAARAGGGRAYVVAFSAERGGHRQDRRLPRMTPGRIPTNRGRVRPQHGTERSAVEPEREQVQQHLDQDERGVEHPVRHDGQRDRDGNRREAEAKAAVHRGGDERGEDQHQRPGSSPRIARPLQRARGVRIRGAHPIPTTSGRRARPRRASPRACRGRSRSTGSRDRGARCREAVAPGCTPTPRARSSFTSGLTLTIPPWSASSSTASHARAGDGLLAAQPRHPRLRPASARLAAPPCGWRSTPCAPRCSVWKEK